MLGGYVPAGGLRTPRPNKEVKITKDHYSPTSTSLSFSSSRLMTELGSVSILLSTSLPSPSHSSFINPGGNVLVLLLILSASQKGLHLVQIIAIGFRRGCYLS